MANAFSIKNKGDAIMKYCEMSKEQLQQELAMLQKENDLLKTQTNKKDI